MNLGKKIIRKTLVVMVFLSVMMIITSLMDNNLSILFGGWIIGTLVTVVSFLTYMNKRVYIIEKDGSNIEYEVFIDLPEDDILTLFEVTDIENNEEK